MSWELHGATVGIVGLGAIGQSVARRFRGFDCTVLAYDVEPRILDGVEAVSLQELLRRRICSPSTYRWTTPRRC